MQKQEEFESFLIKNSIKGVIFDCDGILVDSEHFSCSSLNVLFEKYFNIDIGTDYSSVIGKTMQDSFGYFLERHSLENVDQNTLNKIYIEKDDIYKNLAKNKLKTFDGINEFIQYLLNSDIIIGVASSGNLDKIKFSLTETGLISYFKIITSSDEVKHGKPKPDLFLLCAEKMQLNPKDCLVVEDSLSGIIAGNSAQMFTVGVTNTFEKQILKKSNPNLIVDNVSELI